MSMTIFKQIKGWGHGPNGRVIARHVQGPVFNLSRENKILKNLVLSVL
jgi:ribosomal protein S28E/S33